MPMSPEQIEEFLQAPRLTHFTTVSPDRRPRTGRSGTRGETGLSGSPPGRRSATPERTSRRGRSLLGHAASEELPYRAVVAYGRPVCGPPSATRFSGHLVPVRRAGGRA